uniref:galectin-3-like n=1 Tax=Doryrhamphus excisus TaxID=161450 RepID=UPI0025AE84AA|nr:galectin-3-like [Doryrhamphus excisus]
MNINLSDALDDWPASGGNQSSNQNSSWPNAPSGGAGPGGWPAPQPGGAGPGGWPAPQPGGAGPGGWPAPQPGGTGPGGWPAPQPGGTGPGGWPAPQPGGTGPGGWPAPQPGGTGPGGWPAPQPPAPQPGGTGPGGWPAPQPGGGGPGGWTPSPGGQPSPSTGPGASTQSLSMPFSQSIPRGLEAGTSIVINGVIKDKPDKFTVDFGASGDVVFHFNPRFNEYGKKVIVRNSKIRNKWGQEERDLARFPFTAGQPFQMRIQCTNQMFQVFVNNNHLLDFKHRMGNLRSINQLSIYNDVTLSHVNIIPA